MINWFEVFADKLIALEEGQKEICNLLANSSYTASSNANPYGDFKWLCETCTSIPASTLRIKSAAGEIPGVVKFGKRVLYEKVAVLDWLRSQTRQHTNSSTLERAADDQISRQLSKKGGVRA